MTTINTARRAFLRGSAVATAHHVPWAAPDFEALCRRCDDCIDACEEAVLIIGDGVQKPSLQRLAGELGLSPCVHFLGSRDDIPDLLPALDVFALTSHNEANPVSILEAMACAKPVVATQHRGCEDTVVH